jgi:DNA-binding IclR family transcriptional regulator
MLELSRSFLRRTGRQAEFQRAVRESDALVPVKVVCAVLQGRDVVYIGRRDGTQPVAVSHEVGCDSQAHSIASGLAMLSELPEAHLDICGARGAGLAAVHVRTAAPDNLTGGVEHGRDVTPVIDRFTDLPGSAPVGDRRQTSR